MCQCVSVCHNPPPPRHPRRAQCLNEQIGVLVEARTLLRGRATLLLATTDFMVQQAGGSPSVRSGKPPICQSSFTCSYIPESRSVRCKCTKHFTFIHDHNIHGLLMLAVYPSTLSGNHLGKYAYSLSCCRLDQVSATLISVHYMKSQPASG